MSNPLPFEQRPEPGRVTRAAAAPSVTAVAIAGGADTRQPLQAIGTGRGDSRRDEDPLSAFKSEERLRSAGRGLIRRASPIAFCLVVLLSIAMGLKATYFELAHTPQPSPPTSLRGVASFNSRPSGAEVVIDGVVRGVTPIKLSLPVGLHTLEVRCERGEQVLPVTIEAGLLLSLDLEFALEPHPSIDPIGVVSNRASGPAQLRASPDAASDGWLAIVAPVELQIFEAGRRVGAANDGRLTLAVGRHDLELVNDALEFRTRLAVEVSSGKLANVAVAVPNGLLSINALPWAEVLVDGHSVGTTPIADLSLPIGSHEIVWRHPQLGERRGSVSVRAQSPARIGINLQE